MSLLAREADAAPSIPCMKPQAERYSVPRGLHERETNFKEVLQTAWLEAIAAASGTVVWNPQLVDDGIDAMLHHHHDCHTAKPERIAMLRVQLKTTTKPASNNELKSQVSRKRLREYATVDPSIPTIVAILQMPKMQEHWVYANHRSLGLYGRCAWVNLAGVDVPGGDPKDKIQIGAPIRQVLDDVELAKMMARIGQGDAP